MKRIICFVVGHRWRNFGMNYSKAISLTHLHPQAGMIEVCSRCGKLWDDFRYGFNADTPKAVDYYVRRIRMAKEFQNQVLR